jgi:hypothetical protein
MAGGASADLIQALFKVVVLAIVLERGLSFIFEIRLAGPRLRRRLPGEPEAPMIAEILGATIKAGITYVAAFGLCFGFGFDVFGPLFGVKPVAGPPVLEVFLTAAVVAGGSAGAIKLFQDVLGMSKTARDAAREAREEEAKARLAKAQSDRAVAELTVRQTQQQQEQVRLAEQEAVQKRFSTTTPSAAPRLAASQPWTLRPAPAPSGVQPLPDDVTTPP